MSGLGVHVHVGPPDRRRRDLDNTQKALLDSLQHAGVYRDDSQINDLRITRYAPAKGGIVIVQIAPDCDALAQLPQLGSAHQEDST
jgi:crossover junction endodeoxyribonuclease RusA